ncbi:beta-fructofuranosidase [Angomonas deanei]|nr:beta-fructofuranosidase [Angomonas deanei]|eukprot:EPY38647.1 beta-fructofuranosidase [Angomonas deanei]
MNDPNGLVYFKGLYHVFYQHHPFSAEWGPMHWGHLTSEDMVHWRHHPIALAPGDDWDRDGCFSGSAVEHDGKMYLIYTGHHWLGDTLDDTQIYQVQCLAVSEDGFTFEKKGIIVKPPADYTHFRDPKVWYEDKRWWMVCGARDSKDQGQLLLHSTDDIEDWDDGTFTIVAKSEDKNVYMWECPDVFPLGGKHVIAFSPQGKIADGYSYRNVFQAGTVVGDWSVSELFKTTTGFREMDLGHDFYAPQSFVTPEGRRIIIGWLSMWEGNMPTKKHNWSGQLSIPREVFLDPETETVRCVPIRELVKIRQGHISVPAQLIKSDTQITLLDECVSCEVNLVWTLNNCTGEKYGLWVGKGLEIFVDNQTARLVVNRHYPEHTISGYRSCPLPTCTHLKLTIFFDKSSVEVFVNDGHAVMSSRIYPAAGDRALSAFSINGDAHLAQCEIYGLAKSVLVSSSTFFFFS